uniref:Uncharacterized protein n=1 Tax=Myotis myotis TaxID=51298 RepID=A0A7J7V3K9_MYOMY|nr:hypothetical protein mMyoMyo1_008432 [Myotis myotis]
MSHTEPLASKLCTKELSYLHGKDLQGRNEEARRQDGERAPARPWPFVITKRTVQSHCQLFTQQDASADGGAFPSERTQSKATHASAPAPTPLPSVPSSYREAPPLGRSACWPDAGLDEDPFNLCMGSREGTYTL